ncbi:uncharacterized protein [Haliotis asinina]|uniref:uncharacterized protein n=1 Tax=Haliotis asinina TaxID=109174 RepID=UPI003531A224
MGIRGGSLMSMNSFLRRGGPGRRRGNRRLSQARSRRGANTSEAEGEGGRRGEEVTDHLDAAEETANLWKAPASSGSIVCEKVNLVDQKGQANNLCYKDGSKEIKCPRNQTLLIPSLLQRVHSPEEYEDPTSCSKSVRDNFHDIGRCLLNISDVQEKATYEAAVREVLQECSQKRYCILESDKTSSIHGLRDLPVGKGNRLPSHLVVMHQCVKEQIVLCESKTQTDKEVHISINRLRVSALGTSTCTCTVSGGATNVTLLDVRLGNSNRTGLSISDKTGSVYTAHGGHQTVHYMKEIRMSQTEWSLHLDVVQDYVPDKIWMRVQGYNSTQVTVTCEEARAAKRAPDKRSGEVTLEVDC